MYRRPGDGVPLYQVIAPDGSVIRMYPTHELAVAAAKRRATDEKCRVEWAMEDGRIAGVDYTLGKGFEVYFEEHLPRDADE